MKFALSNDERIEASKGAKGVCPSCGSELIAKCGEIVIHHWAHKKKCDDYWWENETQWHRNWKNKFPDEWQEIGLSGTPNESGKFVMSPIVYATIPALSNQLNIPAPEFELLVVNRRFKRRYPCSGSKTS